MRSPRALVPLPGLVALLAVGGLMVPFGSVAAASGHRPAPVAAATADASASLPAGSSFMPSPRGPQVMVVPRRQVALPERAAHAPTWRAIVSFDCKDQTVSGAIVLGVGRNGRFVQETSGLVSEYDAGSETRTTIRGRLTPAGASGTIDVYARAYDADGTTAECSKDRIPWTASLSGSSDAPRVQAAIPVPDAWSITAGIGSLFVMTSTKGNDATRVRVLDPATNSVVRTITVAAELEQLVAGDGVLWGVARDGRVLRIDPTDGVVRATIDAHVNAIAVAGSTIWGTRDVVRIDAGSDAILATVPVPGRAHGQIAVGPNGVYVEFEAAERNPNGSLKILYARIDPETNDLTTTVPAVPDEGASGLVADADAFWTVASAGGPTVAWDPRTLQIDARAATAGFGVVLAAPGAWIATGSDVTVVDSAGRVVFEQRIVGTAASDDQLAASNGSVWVLAEDVLVRLRTG
jgi:hypothetical protein